MKVVKYFDLTSCPPGYFRISENNTEYCYEIGEFSSWDYPCFESGGASVITDLDENEVNSLVAALKASNQSRYFWLPAHRQKYFNPVVWTIPGQNWGRIVESNNNIGIRQSILRNCLLFDVQNQMIITDSCDKIFPSLCFYINNLNYPATCPEGYHAFRFVPDKGVCFGIEYANTIFGATFEEFLETKCSRPMGNNNESNLGRYIFKKMAELSKLPNNEWCWFESSYVHNGSHVNPRDDDDDERNSDIITDVMVASLEGTINNEASLGLVNTMSTLSCMACETDMLHNETELMFEYNDVDETMYLTIYFPSGLWKYDTSDKGVQCFSNAKGFVRVITIEDTPLLRMKNYKDNSDKCDLEIEKIVYRINPVTARSAQYWCEAHTQNFTLLTTKKILINPQGNKEHVFSLVIETTNIEEEHYNEDDNFPDFTQIIDNITNIFDAKKTLIMDILDVTDTHMMILFHLYIGLQDVYENEGLNILKTYENLTNIAETELCKYNIIFVNMSSSTHCLPTTSEDKFVLNWELTVLGQIAAPKQFCLQSNGLPVKRQCRGSYLLGGTWAPVDGNCGKTYEASNRTTFLYNIAKGQTSINYTSRFLTFGLNYVLDDINMIIPADIYYLSMSFQYILSIAQENRSSIEIGDIKNIAWAMNRVMVLDNTYLRLAQTLNSTNVIVDSVDDIIEIIAQQYKHDYEITTEKHYQIAVEPKFIAQISYPAYNNITGIAIIKTTESDNFTEMTIIPLYKNTTLDYILAIKNIEVATWVPENVLNTLKTNTNESIAIDQNNTINENDIHIVISVFYNDAVFQELDTRENVINSRIIGVAIPGFSSNLFHPVPLIFREINESNYTKICSYWDFNIHASQIIPGTWTKDGCFFVKSVNNLTICKCYHLTHFGQLISIDFFRDGENKVVDQKHNKALNVITLVGCFLSLIGIVGIFITAGVFHSWRQKPGTKVLLQLSLAIALPLLLILVFNLDNSIFIEYKGLYVVAEHMKGVCITLGAILHYSILSGFVWMLITAILQFIRYVRVLGVRRPSRFMFKFTLIGWGLPSLPVMCILIVNRESYLPLPANHDAYSGPICYPTGNYFLYAVVLPVIIILGINVVLFGSVIYSISRGPDGKMRHVDLDLIAAQLRLSIFLFFLLGLSWFFGILTFSNNIIWSYLFCLTSTLQGFVLFLYFVICDPATRSLWITLMKPQFLSTSSRESIVSFNN